MFLQLPWEILDKVLHYCSIADKMNVALSNHDHYALVKPFLWSVVKLTEVDLMQQNFDPMILNNLSLTNTLKLNSNFRGRSTKTGTVSYGYNICTVLNTVNKNNLTALKMNGSLHSDGLYYSLQQLTSLSYLELSNMRNLDETNWKCLSFPGALKKIVMAASVTTNEFIESVIIGNKQLEGLHFINCLLSNEQLNSVGKAENLKNLGLMGIGTRGNELDITPLAGLSLLERLQLGRFSVKEGSLLQLWEGLRSLKVLRMCSVDITDEGVRDISALQNLTNLHVSNCRRMTSEVFVNCVCSLPALVKLFFDGRMFSQVIGEDELRRIFSPLNDLPALQRIMISTCESEHPGCFLRILGALCWGPKKTWTVTADNLNIFNLHKM